LRKHGGLPGSLSTFGFGYSLDSALLEDLAGMGNGTYSFIPDVGMVGTVFVHAVANAMSCLSPHCQVKVNVPGSIVDAWVSTGPQGPGKRAVKKAGQPELVVDLGQLNFGQTRDFVIKVADCAAEDCVVEARLGEVVITGAVSAPSPEKVAVQRGRVELVKALAAARSAAAFGSAKAMPLLGETQTMMQALVAEAGDSGYIGDLLQDLEGQVALAVSRQDWYQKWGTHYLPSLQRAHALQLCNNFKDPGVQHYGGDVFREVRDVADDRFNELPPPVATSATQRRSGAGHSFDLRDQLSSQPVRSAPAPSPQPAFSMALFNSAQGACFVSGAVELAHGGVKDISEVQAGDVLASANGSRRVACVVVTPADDRSVVDLGDGVVVTPWHPVREAGGCWVFPADLRKTELRYGALYSLLLEDGSAFRIGGWEGIALGHGESGPVAGHAFFGSRDAVVRSLRECQGFESGRVIISGVRRASDGRVSGFIPAAADLPAAVDCFVSPPLQAIAVS